MTTSLYIQSSSSNDNDHYDDPLRNVRWLLLLQLFFGSGPYFSPSMVRLSALWQAPPPPAPLLLKAPHSTPATASPDRELRPCQIHLRSSCSSASHSNNFVSVHLIRCFRFLFRASLLCLFLAAAAAAQRVLFRGLSRSLGGRGPLDAHGVRRTKSSLFVSLLKFLQSCSRVYAYPRSDEWDRVPGQRLSV